MRIPPPTPYPLRLYSGYTVQVTNFKKWLLVIYRVLVGFFLQGVLRDQRDLELFDDQFKDAYTPKKVGYFDDDDDESY